LGEENAEMGVSNAPTEEPILRKISFLETPAEIDFKRRSELVGAGLKTFFKKFSKAPQSAADNSTKSKSSHQ
jgi:hypothetical protein